MNQQLQITTTFWTLSTSLLFILIMLTRTEVVSGVRCHCTDVSSRVSNQSGRGLSDFSGLSLTNFIGQVPPFQPPVPGAEPPCIAGVATCPAGVTGCLTMTGGISGDSGTLTVKFCGKPVGSKIECFYMRREEGFSTVWAELCPCEGEMCNTIDECRCVDSQCNPNHQVKPSPYLIAGSGRLVMMMMMTTKIWLGFIWSFALFTKFF